MLKRLARLTLPLACVGVAACGAASADAKLVVGIGDDNPAMFSQPLFQRLHVTTAREFAFWNVAVMKDKASLNATRAWINAAQAAGIKPLVSFAGNGNYIPTVAQYTAAVKAFIHDFPSVKLYTAWNEPDWVYRSLGKNPKLAAQFFNALYQVCRGCTVAAGDLYRPVNDGLAAWIKSYKRALRFKPKAWALHPYDDVRAHKTGQIQTLERYIGNTPIWLTEISGLLRRGHWPYPNQSAAAAGRDEKFLFQLPKRFRNITAIYHYQWQGTVPSPNTGWDSGLIAPNGTPRPAYNVVYNAAHGKLP
jgi:Glycosyl hydrolase catalytic core